MFGFQQLTMAQVPQAQNRMADALASLASKALYMCHVEISIIDHLSISNAAVLMAASQPGPSLMSSIFSYLRNGTLRKDRSEAVNMKARVACYRRSFSGPYQICVPLVELEQIMEKVHRGICSAHIGGRSLCHRVSTSLR